MEPTSQHILFNDYNMINGNRNRRIPTAGFLMRRRLRRISDYPLRDILVPLRGDPAAGEARAEGEGEMIPRALTLVALLIGATAPASAQNKLSWGEGSAPCSDWTKEHKANSAVSMQMSSWLRGYVSGANVMQNFKGNIFAKTKAEMELMARYIDQYCLEHPADSVVVATDKLVKELIARLLAACRTEQKIGMPSQKRGMK